MPKHKKRPLKRYRKNLDLKSGKPKRFVVFSLKDFDRTQGQSFKEWEKEKILSNLLNRLQEISRLTIEEAVHQQIIKPYDSFPPESEFKPPRHVPEDVRWATIRIKGKERVAGYIEENIFYIVFLDKDHKFWISEKKHT